jgi:hypothetical protein
MGFCLLLLPIRQAPYCVLAQSCMGAFPSRFA